MCLHDLDVEPVWRPWRASARRRATYAILLVQNARIVVDADRLAGLDVPGLPAEGYVLDIEPRSVLVAAGDLNGLLYAWQTVRQMIERAGRSRRLPAVTVRDWPELSLRGAHIDLHNLTPTVDAIERRLRVLAGYKINTVLLSYGDRFRFRRHPTIAHPAAFGRAAIRRLEAMASERRIDMVPVIQCLGHSANVLARPRYRALREREDVLTQFCPTNPGTLKLVGELLDEVMDAHRSRFIHVGADETYFLGTCPRCRRIADRKGRIGLYIDYVSKICDQVAARGRVPLIWDDMLCTAPSMIRRMRRVRLCYWDYFPADVDNPFVFFRNHGWYCNRSYWRNRPWWGGEFVDTPRTREVTEMPEAWAESYGSFLSGDPERRYFNPYPFLGFYKQSGMDVIGCSAARGGEYGYHCPNYRRRSSNIRGMTRVVAKHAGAGAITTSWSEMMSPDELTIALFAEGAEAAWAPDSTHPRCFAERFAQEHFGGSSPQIATAMDRIGRHAPPLAFKSEDRTDIMERGQEADRESLVELLDRRIRRYLDEPGLPDRRAATATVGRDAASALDLLKAARRGVRRNRLAFDHLVLAAETLQHKARQAELFCRAELALGSTRRSIARDRNVADGLAACGREATRLRRRLRELFSRSYDADSVRRRDAVVFEGEAERRRTYRKSLLAS